MESFYVELSLARAASGTMRFCIKGLDAMIMIHNANRGP